MRAPDQAAAADPRGRGGGGDGGGGNGRSRGPDALAAAAGLAPVLSRSGRIRYSRGATGGDKALKRVFSPSAFCALRRHPASRTFCDGKRAEGEWHRQTLIALARRRVNVLFAILRGRRPDEDRPAPRLAA